MRSRKSLTASYRSESRNEACEVLARRGILLANRKKAQGAEPGLLVGSPSFLFADHDFGPRVARLKPREADWIHESAEHRRGSNVTFREEGMAFGKSHARGDGRISVLMGCWVEPDIISLKPLGPKASTVRACPSGARPTPTSHGYTGEPARDSLCTNPQPVPSPRNPRRRPESTGELPKTESGGAGALAKKRLRSRARTRAPK